MVFMNEQGNRQSQTERRKLRRNTRIRMRFPVTVEVPAGNGRTRVLKAHTVVVSHAGATLEMDEGVPTEIGLQVTPPFGGTILAEVNDGWVDQASGRHHVSIRLIDPATWTSPERLRVAENGGAEAVNLALHPRLWQLLAEYTDFLNEKGGGALSAADAGARLLEEAILADVRFQDWFAAKIMEDLKAWEEMSVLQQ